jgi:small subunit ribosomal protein S6
LLFIAEPTLDQERLAAIQERISNLISQGEGAVDSVDDWGIRRFAYQIKKFAEGRYMLVNFQCPATRIDALNKQMRLVQDVIRFVVVRKGD